ncbi:MAG: TetR/AcrR family transcriptional regulator [Actinobacteria bacterium]|nr:TetR/AcrR family transcriptional regulator [Actinomycetota bacterium]
MGSLTADSSALAGRREERKAQNRSKLLTAARRVFAEKGLGEATARDIVRETDLATGTFYNYFDDKEDAFRALLRELAEKAITAAREQRHRPGSTLEERVGGAYRSFFAIAVEDRELFQVFRRNASAIAMMPDEDLFEAGIQDLSEDLVDWALQGELPQGAIDLDYLAASMAGVGFQVATRLIERDPPDVDTAARFCTRLFMGGIDELAVGEASTPAAAVIP